MSPIRQQNNPLILKLLREHDSLDLDQREERKALQRRILFLMTTIKLHELEAEHAAPKSIQKVMPRAWIPHTAPCGMA